MSQAGYPHTVAPLGTALTGDQCELLWRMAGEPILCFDGDKAGQKAAFRAIEMALPLIGPGRSLRFALLPEGQDPDDLARSAGRREIAQVVEAARPLAEMLFLREDRGRTFRHARAPRGAGAAAARVDRNDRRRDAAPPLSGGHGGAAGGLPRLEPARRGGEARGRGREAGGDMARPECSTPGPRLGFAAHPLPKRQALTGKPKDAPRDVVILALVVNHPRAAGAPHRGNRRARAVQPGAGRVSGPASRPGAGRAVGEEAWRRRGLPPSGGASLQLAAQTPLWWCLRPEADFPTPIRSYVRRWPCIARRGR